MQVGYIRQRDRRKQACETSESQTKGRSYSDDDLNQTAVLHRTSWRESLLFRSGENWTTDGAKDQLAARARKYAEAAFHASRVPLPSLMGNQLDRITHLSYSELPTGDPSGVEKDELRVGVAYFFSDDEEELDERSPSEEVAAETPDELEYSAFCCHECIFSKARARGDDLRVYPARTLLAMCKPGDVLELVASAQAPHWAVFEGDDQVIHLHKGEIRKDSLLDVSGGRRGRIANDRYRFRPLPPDLVVRNAIGHLGLSRADVCWTSSESFAAWCRFGKREFKAGGEAHSAGQRYLLKVHLSESTVHTLVFRSLEELVRERRRVDASGILEELSLQ
ncbi:hypothetical protein HF521_008027 [Silurus meridionalis]|uniref:LRAT domain-containing protein n=2 Tax=Silurus meridionalis TaxID=175797 RepID=A0A8T0ARU7_SILME|nr:hypothetical protein HF521_008027 [Silurus meridionalis]